MSEQKIWTCKIGEVPDADVPPGADAPMRRAVSQAYEAVTDHEPQFIFSGWGGTLTEGERAVVDDAQMPPAAPGRIEQLYELLRRHAELNQDVANDMVSLRELHESAEQAEVVKGEIIALFESED